MAKGTDGKGHASGIVGTMAFHLLILLTVAMAGTSRSEHNRATSSLAIFDIAPPPPPPAPPPPRPAEIATVRKTPSSGSPRPASASPAPASAVLIPQVREVTIVPLAPPVAISGAADTSASGTLGALAGSGSGSGGTGSAPGSGFGNASASKTMWAGAEWIHYPTTDEMDRYWPHAARSRKVGGTVVLACLVPRPGPPERCTVVSETPTDIGFGEAALRMSADFLIRPITRDKAVLAIPIIVPVEFAYDRR